MNPPKPQRAKYWEVLLLYVRDRANPRYSPSQNSHLPHSTPPTHPVSASSPNSDRKCGNELAPTLRNLLFSDSLQSSQLAIQFHQLPPPSINRRVSNPN